MRTPEIMDYKELKSYQVQLIHSRMFDHRLRRIERLVVDAYIDRTTIDYVGDSTPRAGGTADFYLVRQSTYTLQVSGSPVKPT